jgi:hypothetical protein
MSVDVMRARAEALWEELGGDLCLCQQREVPHWCERCQQRMNTIAAAFHLLPPPAPLLTLVRDLQAHAREHGWQDCDTSIANLLAIDLGAFT